MIQWLRCHTSSGGAERSIHCQGTKIPHGMCMGVQLYDPMDCSSVHGIFQARILEWVASPFSKGSSQLGLNPGLLHCRQILSCQNHQGSVNKNLISDWVNEQMYEEKEIIKLFWKSIKQRWEASIPCKKLSKLETYISPWLDDVEKGNLPHALLRNEAVIASLGLLAVLC